MLGAESAKGLIGVSVIGGGYTTPGTTATGGERVGRVAWVA